MNAPKMLLKKCAPVLLVATACSLLSNCDSSNPLSSGGGSAADNLTATAKALTDARLYDYVSFESTIGVAGNDLLDFSSSSAGTLQSTGFFQNNVSDEDLASRKVLQVSFANVFLDDHVFQLKDVTTNVFASQFADHVRGIYAGTFATGGAGLLYGFDSVTRQITLNSDGDFNVAELDAISDEFNGFLAATTEAEVDDSADLLRVNQPTQSLYVLDKSDITFTITSTNQDRIRGILRGTYQVVDYGQVIRWRAPVNSEIGDAGTYRLEPTNLVPYISGELINLGVVDIGNFELRLVAGQVN